jgi:hypothetical protein
LRLVSLQLISKLYQYAKIYRTKKSFLLLGLLMPTVWQGTYATSIMDGYSFVIIKSIAANPKHNAP